MAEKSANYGPDLMRMAEKSLLLQLLDQTWKDHLLSLDHLRQGINLRAYAQRDPLNEYKREAFELFEAMLANLRQHVTSVLSHVELRVQPEPVFAMAGGEPEEAMAEERATGTTGRPIPAAAHPAPRRLRQRRRPRRAAPGRPARPVGRHPAQRPLPLRLRQEIQALPRPSMSGAQNGALSTNRGLLAIERPRGGCIAQLVEQLTLNQRVARFESLCTHQTLANLSVSYEPSPGRFAGRFTLRFTLSAEPGARFVPERRRGWRLSAERDAAARYI